MSVSPCCIPEISQDKLRLAKIIYEEKLLKLDIEKLVLINKIRVEELCQMVEEWIEVKEKTERITRIEIGKALESTLVPMLKSMEIKGELSALKLTNIEEKITMNNEKIDKIEKTEKTEKPPIDLDQIGEVIEAKVVPFMKVIETKSDLNTLKLSNLESKIGLKITPKEVTKSVELGQIGEDYVRRIIEKKYKLEDTRHTGGKGDYCVENKIIVEVKNYSGPVPTREIEKFRRDMIQTNKRGGIMISLGSPIMGKRNFKIEWEKRRKSEVPLLYIRTKEEELILTSIEILLVNIDVIEKKELECDVRELEILKTVIENMRKVIEDIDPMIEDHNKIVVETRKSHEKMIEKLETHRIEIIRETKKIIELYNKERKKLDEEDTADVGEIINVTPNEEIEIKDIGQDTSKEVNTDINMDIKVGINIMNIENKEIKPKRRGRPRKIK